ncbi:MAG: N-acetylneuraminate synthase family protein [Candidatus Limnocylindria bacterium]
MTFAIGSRVIGPKEPPFVIAEAGVNHNGDFDLAVRLIDAALEAGADAVKFQTFDAQSLATAQAERAVYQRSAGDESSQLAMLESIQLPDDRWPDLARHAADRGIIFLSTPFDEPSVALLAELNLAAMKVGSGDLTNALLLRAVGRLGIPVILSTGMGTIGEVDDAVGELRDAGAPSIALLHCASIYPAAIDDVNLRAIDTLRAHFEIPVGFSDHTEGGLASPLAVARGAMIIEKHLTLDRSLPGPDHASSLELVTFSRLVTDIRDAWRALGDGQKRPRPGEQEIMRVARRSLVARRALPAGHLVEPDDLDAKRPGTGISPMRVDAVVGRRLAVGVGRDHLLQPADLDPPLDSPA